MAKKTEIQHIEYVTKEQAKVHRKYKTTLIEEACSEIVAKKGTVTPKLLVEAAKSDNHPLHDAFDWHDSIAGMKWRKAQAMAMIIATKYVCHMNARKKQIKNTDIFEDAKKSVQVRRFLPSHDGTGFRDRASILSEAESRKAIIERKLGVLRSWCLSVIDIEELQPVRETILSAIS